MISYPNYIAYRKIEHYLYNYTKLDEKIDILKSSIKDAEYNQSYTKYIKNKSSSLEDLVIRNIEIKQKIFKINRWKSLITIVLDKYKSQNEIFYNFMNLKYINRETPEDIQEKLNLSLQEQKDIKADILQYILLLAIKNKMLKGGEF